MTSSNIVIFILFLAVAVIGVLYGLKISEPVKKCPTCPTCRSNYKKLVDTDFDNYNIPGGVIDGTYAECEVACDAAPDCTGFARDETKNKCYLKKIFPDSKRYSNGISTYYMNKLPLFFPGNQIVAASAPTAS